MSESKLSSGVGRKIVEALKKQSEIDVQPVAAAIDDENNKSVIKDAVENTLVYQEAEQEITDNIELEDEFSNFDQEESVEVAEIPEENVEEPEIDTFELNDSQIDSSSDNAFLTDFDNTFGGFSFEENQEVSFDEKELFSASSKAHVQSHSQQRSYAVPANVAVLKKLIGQLPQDVSKQTGAQIIRQTMEALGISMKSVLKEAQQGQESITVSAKACLSKIAEYKNSIRGLEKQVQEYKEQAVELNDLISLFVMTGKQ